MFEVPVAVQPYGIEFSPLGDILYASGSGGLAQYDITLPTAFLIQSSTTFLANEITDNSWGAMQLAADGKIYITRSAINDAPDIKTLSVINNPAVLGASCDFQLDTVSLGLGIAQVGLPPFIQSFFQIGFQAQNICEGNATQFSSNISQAYDAITWDFGDGATSTDENPSHTYASAGDYEVSLSVTSGTESSTETKTITVYKQPIANPIADQVACDEDGDGFYFYDLTMHAAEILNGQDPTVFELTYYDGIANYNSGQPIADAASFENLTFSSANPVISISNRNNPSCEAFVTIHIDFLEGANPSQTIPDITSCDNTSFGSDTDGIVLTDLTQLETAVLNSQSTSDFSVRYFTDAAFTNEITNPSGYQNTTANETIYVQVENNTSALCNAATSFNLVIHPLPTVTPIVTLSQCDDDTDGFSIFNLTEVKAELSTNYQTETIRFYESFTDAETETDVILNETAYTNETVSTDRVWARIENANGCYRIAEVNLIISTTQIPLAFTRAFYACDDAINGTTTDGVSSFDFSNVTTEIEAIFPVGQQLSINYYRNLQEALSEINPITDITDYRNISYPNTQDIFIRVDSALNNDCLGLGQHITLTVETVPIANAITIAEQCDTDGDNSFAFDTSTIEDNLLNGQTNVIIAYEDAIGNPLPSPLPNPFLTSSQQVTARLTNSTSQNPNGACSAETILEFKVQTAAVANPIADVLVCDDDDDGFFNFDTITIESTLLNGQIGMVVSYTDEAGNPLSSPLPNPFFTDTQNITARVENTLSSACFDETIINFIVVNQPIANTIGNDFVCDDASNDGEHIFTLSDYNPQILGSQSNTIFEVLYFDSDTNAQTNLSPLPNLYMLNSTSQTIFSRIQNINNSNCYAITSFELGLNYLPIAYQPADVAVCDDESNDGFETFNLAFQNDSILNGQSAIENAVSYHLSLQDAQEGVNAQSANFTNTTNPQIVFARIENLNASNCFSTTAFELSVKEQPLLLMNSLWPICEGSDVQIIADEGYDYYTWSTGQTTRIITVDSPGQYSVTASNIYGDLICSTEKSLTVSISDIAIITNIETVDWTQTENSIAVFVEGNGDYEYSLDGMNYQEEFIFNGLPASEYTVYVRDKNGCGITNQEVYLLNYPRYFTPNGDGTNDFWQIKNSAKEPLNKLSIYNRYGKLIMQLKPNDFGWDGTHNGNRLPSDDYWFVLERQNGKTYTGHFSLKR